MKKFNVIVCVFFILHGVTAQETSLSLSEALRVAVSKNYGILIAKNDAALAAHNNNWTNAGAYPELRFNANPSISSNSLEQKLVNGTEIKRNNALSEVINANVQLNWNLFNGFKLYATKDRLTSLERIGQLNIESEILSLVYEVSAAYYNVIRLQNLSKVTREQITVSKDRVALEEKKFNLGRGGKSDLLQAKLDLQELQIIHNKQENDVQDAYAQLFHLMQEKQFTTPRLTDTISGKQNISGIGIQMNYDQHPQLKILNEQMLVNSLTKRELLAERIPSINFLGAYNFNRTENQAGFNLFSLNYGPIAQLQISVPLFDGKRISKSSKALDYSYQTIALQKEMWASNTNYEIELNNRKAEQSLKIYELEQSRMQLALENLEVIKEKLRLASITSLEFSQAQFTIIDIAAKMQDALYESMLAKLQVDYLSGKLSDKVTSPK
jgi:outer membrane protein